MKRVFVDTSAILALLNPADVHHEAAKRGFLKLQSKEVPLITTSYVLVEVLFSPAAWVWKRSRLFAPTWHR